MATTHTSRHSDFSTADYTAYILNRSYIIVSLMCIRRQYPIAPPPLFRGNLAHAQTMCTRLFLHDPQNVSRGEPGNEATLMHSFAISYTCLG